MSMIQWFYVCFLVLILPSSIINPEHSHSQWTIFVLPSDVCFIDGLPIENCNFNNLPSGRHTQNQGKIHHAINGKIHELSTGPWLQVRKL